MPRGRFVQNVAEIIKMFLLLWSWSVAENVRSPLNRILIFRKHATQSHILLRSFYFDDFNVYNTIRLTD